MSRPNGRYIVGLQYNSDKNLNDRQDLHIRLGTSKYKL